MGIIKEKNKNKKEEYVNEYQFGIVSRNGTKGFVWGWFWNGERQVKTEYNSCVSREGIRHDKLGVTVCVKKLRINWKYKRLIYQFNKYQYTEIKITVWKKGAKIKKECDIVVVFDQHIYRRSYNNVKRSNKRNKTKIINYK